MDLAQQCGTGRVRESGTDRSDAKECVDASELNFGTILGHRAGFNSMQRAPGVNSAAVPLFLLSPVSVLRSNIYRATRGHHNSPDLGTYVLFVQWHQLHSY